MKNVERRKSILRVLENSYIVYVEDAYTSIGACLNASTRQNKRVFRAKVIRAWQNIKQLKNDLEFLKKSNWAGDDWKYLDSILVCLKHTDAVLMELKERVRDSDNDKLLDYLVNEARDRILMTYNEIVMKTDWLSA